MIESSVRTWGMILLGKNKVLDLALCRGAALDLVPEIYVIFHFYVTFK